MKFSLCLLQLNTQTVGLHLFRLLHHRKGGEGRASTSLTLHYPSSSPSAATATPHPPTTRLAPKHTHHTSCTKAHPPDIQYVHRLCCIHTPVNAAYPTCHKTHLQPTLHPHPGPHPLLQPPHTHPWWLTWYVCTVALSSALSWSPSSFASFHFFAMFCSFALQEECSSVSALSLFCAHFSLTFSELNSSWALDNSLLRSLRVVS